MSINLPSRGGPSGWSPVSYLKHLLVEALEVLAIGALGLVLFISFPGNPWAPGVRAWVGSYFTQLLNNALWFVFVGGGVVFSFGALMFFFSKHHDLGKRTAMGAGIAILIGLGVKWILIPHLSPTGVVS